MTVKLLHHTPLWVSSTAIRKCWASEGKSDTREYQNTLNTDAILEDNYGFDASKLTGPKDKELIHRIGNKFKHASTLEHLTYNFDIDGISRACLQELARHRIASISVKSSRYTLKELKATETLEELKQFLVTTKDALVDDICLGNLHGVRKALQAGKSNDIAKYCLPEAYKTSLVWSVNARSLQNFLSLRTDKAALWEIRDLANEIHNQLPEEHKYLFTEFIKEP